jgi:tagatose 1,6-diphosphate aldolase
MDETADKTYGLSLGTFRRLTRLADSTGRFSMLAVDQRGSLRRMIARKTGEEADNVPARPLGQIKRIVTETIAQMASGILTDPLYGYPASIHVIPSDVGVLLANEKTGYVPTHQDERRSRLLDNWSVERTVQSGADAVKLLIYHHPEASTETLDHQKEIVETVGAACVANDVPFILEAVTYAMKGRDKKSAEFARRKPDLVVRTTETYSDPRFNVDLLKLEFPASLEFTKEYQDTPYGSGTIVYDRAAVEETCHRLDQAAQMPWVILSAGVDIDEFIEDLRLTNAAGGSGFLCGRAVWKRIIEHYPDEQGMHQHMDTDGRSNFRKLLEVNSSARPWFEHPRFAQYRSSERSN